MTDKKAAIAESYGMGDVKIGLITGQYPNPSFLPDDPPFPGTTTGRWPSRGPEMQFIRPPRSMDPIRRHAEIKTDYSRLEDRISDWLRTAPRRP